jgi:hypothetical protein
MSNLGHLLVAAAYVCLAAVPGVSQAQSKAAIKQGESACAEAVKGLNVLADFTESGCTPAKGTDGKISLIFISKHRVFDNAQRKRAYLAFLVGAAGNALNKRPNLQIDWVTAIDPELGEKRRYWRLSASDTRRLQKQIHDGAIKPDQFITEIDAKSSLQPVDKTAK